ncbi:hypothetical protein [Streptomyces sp. R35]|uniref:Uncharacterized protein n=1 Tax=Streptomyces sp. R35 TaxID=3238630 RepID=A0AB39S7V2_9ACTN
MFRGRKIVQNKHVARQMRRFFSGLTVEDRMESGNVARMYGKHMWSGPRQTLTDEKRLLRSRYYVGLGVESAEFDDATKRSVLISDTLLLSHGKRERYVDLGSYRNEGGYPAGSFSDGGSPDYINVPQDPSPFFQSRYGFHCPDTVNLGDWLLASEPLLKAGLAWYLPNYSTTLHVTELSGERGAPVTRHVAAVDYLLRDGRAIDMSGAEPVTGDHIREVLRIELPFLSGVSLRDFSKITTEEFRSYSAFKDFLRMQLLEIDESLNDVQSQKALRRIGLQIAEEVRSVESQMRKARKRRAVSVMGGALASATAALVAVYGPTFEKAIEILGVSGGVWTIITGIAESDTRTIREDKWYYVWALSRESHTL